MFLSIILPNHVLRCAMTSLFGYQQSTKSSTVNSARMLKRFENNELGESASRRVSYHCKADYAKSSRAMCHGCETTIDQGELRLALMLQDMEGYKSAAWHHFDCFWKHPETWKLVGTHEIYEFGKLKSRDRTRISRAFDKFNASKTTAAKRRARDDDDNDDDYEPDSEVQARPAKKRKTSRGQAKKGTGGQLV